MNLRALFQRRPPPTLPRPDVLSALPYQAAHDLACGRDPAQERARRQAEKAGLPVRYRPADPVAGAAYDASRRAPPARATPARAVQEAPPVFCLDFGAAVEAGGVPGAAVPGPALPAALAYDEDCIPDHVLEVDEVQTGVYAAAPGPVLSAATAPEPVLLTAVAYDEDRIPDHVLEEEAGRPAAEAEAFEAPALLGSEEALMAILSAELRGAVGRAATRARTTPLHGAA
ncbi:hypothetical protein K7W42_13145 [Deinococcus sp. HMF7604]|uniref:hypothetical protein n=1 Tax=Deinococcus betulae TaxID=2873312 RepID=UPI001CCFDC01|nr:hypothetical protein [Deinococcus betulae]MBZ9751804.1 hypothetical protein [Deinococcus betulae]